jgi:nitroreductase
MSEAQLSLTNDQLLSTTRAVRKRLDFERDVPMSTIKECMDLAVQAPSGSNAQGWQFVFVTDQEKKTKDRRILPRSLQPLSPYALRHSQTAFRQR